VCDEAGRVIVAENELISPGQVEGLAALGLTALRVRSPMTCQAPTGLCRRCYGADLATGRLVEVGTAVGVLAAQSIGAPGTQLTLDTFRLGRVAGRDIVNDLEKVTRLLEAYTPAQPAVLAPVTGVVRLVAAEDGSATPSGWWLDEVPPPRVEDGQHVTAGTPLTAGEVDPRALLSILGPEATGAWLLEEVRQVYKHHSLEIDDRHFEVVLARMLCCALVIDEAKSGLLPGQVVPRSHIEAMKKKPARWVPYLLGVSQVPAKLGGFLGAAAFQRTIKVLGEAALASAVDRLEGLHERVMLGRCIGEADGR